MNRIFAGLLAVFLALPAGTGHSGTDIGRIAYDAADMLENNLVCGLNKTIPILVSGFVDIHTLEPSDFGRLMGDRIGSRFSQRGYHIVEPKLRKNTVLMDNRGETALTRDFSELSMEYDFQAAIVGTYHVSDDGIHVSAKIVGTSDRRVLSSWDFSVKTDDNIRELAGMPFVETFPDSGKGIAPENTQSELENVLREGPLSSGLILLQPSVPLGAKIIQKRLSDLGFYTAGINGKWGKIVRMALKKFKKSVKLPANGKWNMETQKALFRDTGQ